MVESPTAPRYLFLPSAPDGASASNGGPAADRLAPLGPFVRVGSVDELLAPTGPGEGRPGWVVVPSEAPPSEVVALLRRLGEEAGEWSPLLVAGSDGALRAIPLSPGFSLGFPEALERMERAPTDPNHVSLRFAMKATSRIRHDINNPLTAALAEVQLLLMDVEPGSPMEESLHAVETQLRRLGELVAGLTTFRTPAR